MIRYPVKTRLFAVCLSALAGYIDAIGFLGSGGFFVSFMSGNSTRLGVGVALSGHFAAIAGALVAAFVLGVIAASLIGRKRIADRPRAILILVACALTLAATLGAIAPPLLTFAVVAFAMGAENMIFETDGEVRIGLTYMTGTLVKAGQKMAEALSGGHRWAWVPFLSLWCGLIGGGIVGAFSHAYFGIAGLWPAAAVAFGLAGLVSRVPLNISSATRVTNDLT